MRLNFIDLLFHIIFTKKGMLSISNQETPPNPEKRLNHK